MVPSSPANPASYRASGPGNVDPSPASPIGESAPVPSPPIDVEPPHSRDPDHQVTLDIYSRQIQSALDRGDSGTAERIRVEYEGFLAGWRAQVELQRAFPWELELEQLPSIGPERARDVRCLLQSARENSAWRPSDSLLYGAVLYLLGEYRQALDIYDTLIGTLSDEARLHRNRGFCFAHLELWELSQRAFERSLSFSPHHPVALRGLGMALVKRGEARRAQVQLQRSLERDPRHAETLFLVGEAQAMLDQHHEAAASYRQALKRDPQNRRYLHRYSRTLILLGRVDLAVQALDLSFGAREFEVDITGELLGKVPRPTAAEPSPVERPAPPSVEPSPRRSTSGGMRRARQRRGHRRRQRILMILLAITIMALATVAAKI